MNKQDELLRKIEELKPLYAEAEAEKTPEGGVEHRDDPFACHPVADAVMEELTAPIPVDDAPHRKLLKKLARKPVTRFQQVDGFNCCHPDGDLMNGDTDGDCIIITDTDELMNGAPVRVLIHQNTDRETALRLLKKILKALKRNEYTVMGLHTEGLPF